MKEVRSNPVIDRFVTTDLDLETIVADIGLPPSPMVNALLLLTACLEGRRLARDAIAAARAAPLAGEDPELAILMLCRWTELACRLSRPSEAEALLHQAGALISSTTHPGILAVERYTRAILADARGNQAEHEAGLREVIEHLPEDSPRRKYYVWELGLLLARQGRGIEFRKPMQELTWQCNERFTADRLTLVQFLDAVETGRIREASSLMPRIAGRQRPRMVHSRIPYADYQQLLALMHAVLSQQIPRHELVLPERPAWCQVVFHLLQHNHTEALKWSRLEAKRALHSIFGTGFDSLNLVRAELASGNGDAARRLLQLRAARGNHHFMDPLFHARCALLSGNRREAVEQVRILLPDIDRYAARGRLDFELMMAAELPSGEMLDLIRQAGVREGRQNPMTAPQAAPPPVQEEDSDQGLQPQHGVTAILGRSTAITAVREAILRLADLDAPVLITGETGTGKELIAKALHAEGSRRRQPFIPVNCGAIPETLLESELFGYERGAFTGADRASRGLFEDARKGTLLLDEIGEITPRLQMALLRVLETGEVRAIGSTKPRKVNCRVLAATNADLEARVEAGLFRRDLVYRLQRLCIHIPPLRERRDDIMLLARRFLDEDRPVGTHTSVSRAFIETLRTYDWPGNVRELRNVIERLRLTHSDKTVYSEADLDIRARPVTPPPPPPGPAPASPHAIAPEPPPAGGIPPAPILSPELDRMILSGSSPLRRLDTVRECFRRYHKLTRGEIISVLRVSPNTATKYLKILTEEGLIRRVEPSASTRSHYFTRVTESPEPPGSE